MPCAIDWYIENEVIYVHYSGTTTADELRDSLQTSKSLIEQSPRHLVHVIIDVGDVTRPLRPMDSLRVARDEGIHPRTGWQIIYREKSTLMKVGIGLGTSLLKSRTRTMDTTEEIIDFLRQMDSTLSWEKVNDAIIMSAN